MSLPVVAIVGRPNVGKSSLLNCLAGRRIAIVDAVPGVTRDRISAPVPIAGGYVELIDTGGFTLPQREDRSARVSEADAGGRLESDVVQQIDYAVASAALIVFVVDARVGATALDRAMADRLRKQNTPVILVANKLDTPDAVAETGELNALGFGEPLEISALHRLGIEDLLEAIGERVGPGTDRPAEAVMKLAIVGKRNVGKSTFINALAGGDRVIVSETPGTTRDSVDVTFEMDGRTLTAIDTAGVRRKSKLADDIEFYSRHRALRSIRRADVVALMIDGTAPVGQVDKHLVAYVTDLFKPVVLVVNKWDLAEAKGAERDEYGPYLTGALPEIAYAPIAITQAHTGQGVREAVALAGQLFAQAQRRVSTGQLNAALGEIVARHGPRAGRSGRPARLYYAAQIATAPPTIVCFVSQVDAFDPAYQRYLLNQFRQRLPFAEVPIRLLFRPRRRREKP